MMSDRAIAPGPRRLDAAWRAGLRPRARWLVTGTGCLGLAAAVDLGGEPAVRRWGAWLRSGTVNGGDLIPWLAAWGLGLLVALALALAVAVALRNFGPVGPRERDLPSGVRTPVFAVAGLALAVFTLLVLALAPVAAGAARAVDASDVALAGLWARWATQMLGTSGVLLLVAGVVEHLAMRHGLWRDLHMTRAQAREQSRQPGGR